MEQMLILNPADVDDYGDGRGRMMISVCVFGYPISPVGITPPTTTSCFLLAQSFIIVYRWMGGWLAPHCPGWWCSSSRPSIILLERLAWQWVETGAVVVAAAMRCLIDINI